MPMRVTACVLKQSVSVERDLEGDRLQAWNWNGREMMRKSGRGEAPGAVEVEVGNVLRGPRRGGCGGGLAARACAQ